jgi:hypothetical protein
MIDAPHPIDFFAKLKWIDGRPLLDTVEDYRRRIFAEALYTFDDDDRPRYNLVLAGRAKKNWKSADEILAALYRFLVWPSPSGNDVFILANDEGQAGDDLALAKKLVAANPIIAREVEPRAKEILRVDGAGRMQILPARDIAGSHGKTYLFVGFDEIHAYRDYNLIEALAPDPTRFDALTWITSYAGLRHSAGIPLHDLIEIGKRGDDLRMFFSWYGGDYTTDPDFSDCEPEQRANPSMASWGNSGYLAQQRRRLPTHKYRRRHLNLPGAPDGAAFSADAVLAAIVPGRKRLTPEPGIAYTAAVDMSGGSNDDACLSIAHYDTERRRAVLDLLVSQTGKPPFDPRAAIRKFVQILAEWGINRVTGDVYAGQTFRADFEQQGIAYSVAPAKHVLYDALEPKLNAGEVELLDITELRVQLLTLVVRGGKIDHQAGDHDDFANAAALAIYLVSRPQQSTLFAMPIVEIVPRGFPEFVDDGSAAFNWHCYLASRGIGPSY